MTIDLDAEQLITFAQLAQSLPRRRAGRPIHVSTIHRWRSTGLRGVRLEAVRVGGAWHTTLEAFARFCAAMTALETDDDPRSVTTAARRRACAEANDQLDEAGW